MPNIYHVEAFVKEPDGTERCVMHEQTINAKEVADLRYKVQERIFDSYPLAMVRERSEFVA